jgi:hypothetical protein
MAIYYFVCLNMNDQQKPGLTTNRQSLPQINFLAGINNRVLVPGIIFLFGVIGTACYQWGKHDAELGAAKLKQTVGQQQQKINSLIDTILTIKLSKKDTITSMQEPH